MQSRTGISRQQYQKLESQGNPRLETLEIIAAGLNAQLMLIPDDKVHLIRQLLNDEIKVTIEDQDDLMTNPWKGLLGERTMNTVAVLKLTLHHAVVGYLAGFQSGKIFWFYRFFLL